MKTMHQVPPWNDDFLSFLATRPAQPGATMVVGLLQRHETGTLESTLRLVDGLIDELSPGISTDCQVVIDGPMAAIGAWLVCESEFLNIDNARFSGNPLVFASFVGCLPTSGEFPQGLDLQRALASIHRSTP